MKHEIKSRNMPVGDFSCRELDSENTVELIWSTGFKGLRSDFGESFFEELEMSEEACDLTRLNAGAPFLDQHTQSTKSTLGVVESARIEDGIGKAIVRFSQRPELQGIISDIKSGILRNISVGYKIFEFTDVTRKGETKTLRATKWQPMEISLVAVGFDPYAQVLRSNEEINEVTIKENTMTEEEKKLLEELLAKQAAEKETAPLEDKPTEEQATNIDPEDEQKKQEQEMMLEEEKKKQAEQERCESIKTSVRAAGLTEDYADELIERGVQDFTTEIFNKLKQPLKETKQMDKKQQLEQALLNRVNARTFEIDSANPYKQASLLTIASELVERKAGESDSQFALRAIASTDVATLLQNVANKLLMGNGQEKYSYRKIAEEVSLRDFKATPIVRIANSGLSDKGSETGDYAAATITNSGETITLKDRGQLFQISHKALMNDDLGVLKDIGTKAPDMGQKDIEKQLYALINANAALSDTKAWFHADHENLVAAGTAPTVEQLDECQQMMRSFVDSSSENMDLAIKYLIVPSQYELAAKQLVSQMFAGTTGEVNPFAGQVEVIVSGRLTGNNWYVMCDPKEFAPVVFGTLEGQSDMPEVQVEEDFNSKNLKIRVTQPSAVAAASHKGIIKVVVA